MATIAADMISEGKDVINFSVGEPDFNTPEHIIKAGKKAMDEGYTKYTSGAGMVELMVTNHARITPRGRTCF